MSNLKYKDYEDLKKVNPELYEYTLALTSEIPAEMEKHERKYRNIKNKNLYVRLRNALIIAKEELSTKQQEYLKNLVIDLNTVLEQKNTQDKITTIENSKKKYSKEEIDFLNQIDTWYLNWYEAAATGRTQEYDNLIRIISFHAQNANIPLMVTVSKHNEDLSPLQYYESLKKFQDEMKQTKKSSK